MIPVITRATPHRLSKHLILAGLLGLSASALTALPAGEDTPLRHALATIERDHADLCPATRSQEGFEVTTVRLEDEILADLTSGRSTSATVEALNRRIFGLLGMNASTDLKDPCNLLPSHVLERKQGYCVGIAAVYLALAGRLQLPVYAVATPSNVFLRCDDAASSCGT